MERLNRIQGDRRSNLLEDSVISGVPSYDPETKTMTFIGIASGNIYGWN